MANGDDDGDHFNCSKLASFLLVRNAFHMIFENIWIPKITIGPQMDRMDGCLWALIYCAGGLSSEYENHQG